MVEIVSLVESVGGHFEKMTVRHSAPIFFLTQTDLLNKIISHSEDHGEGVVQGDLSQIMDYKSGGTLKCSQVK